MILAVSRLLQLSGNRHQFCLHRRNTFDMNNFYRLILLLVFACNNFFQASAQFENQRVKVAVFTPLYLSDAFDGSNYKLGKSNLPKNILPGLEFYNGIMLAIDSLNNEGVNAEISIYDSKQDPMDIERLFSEPAMQDVGLIIAALTTASELKYFGAKALQKNIPFVSATYPNYVGITQNPSFILLNSSFGTHIEGLYKYMQRNYSASEIIAFKRPGSTEDYIKNTITDLNKRTSTSPIKIRWVDMKDDFISNDVTKYLDSLKSNVIFVASPLEIFGANVVKTIGKNSKYNVTAIGMPTWDAVRDFNRREYENVEIIYSTPFNYSSNEYLNRSITKEYKYKYKSRPSDMVFKGFETTYHFTKLLQKHRQNLLANLSDKEFTVFNNFDIQPVKLKKSNTLPDFLENKKLYFVKKRGGNVMSIY